MWNALLNGEIVFAEDLTADERRNNEFLCIGCGKSVIYVHGSDRASHFRHFRGEGQDCPLVEIQEDSISTKEAENFRMLRDRVANEIYRQLSQEYSKVELQRGKIRIQLETSPNNEILDLMIVAGYISEVAVHKFSERVTQVPFHHLIWIVAVQWSMKDIFEFNFDKVDQMPQTHRSVFEYIEGVQPLIITPNGRKFFIQRNNWSRTSLKEILKTKGASFVQGTDLGVLTPNELTFPLRTDPTLRKWLPKKKVTWLKKETRKRKSIWITRANIPLPLRALAAKSATTLPELLLRCLKKDGLSQYWLVGPFEENQYQALCELPAFQEPIYEKDDLIFFAPYKENQEPVILLHKDNDEWAARESIDLVETLGWLSSVDFQIIVSCLEKKGDRWYIKENLSHRDIERLIRVFPSVQIQNKRIYLFSGQFSG